MVKADIGEKAQKPQLNEKFAMLFFFSRNIHLQQTEQ